MYVKKKQENKTTTTMATNEQRAYMLYIYIYVQRADKNNVTEHNMIRRAFDRVGGKEFMYK